MLTYPSDPLPQIVCPMDEDAIPPNRFCSTLPHNEHPTPLLPFSSITPSCANDGISGHRRGGRIQGIKAPTLKKQCNTDSQATAKLSRQNPSPLERQRENESMVQLSLSQQSSVKRTRGHENQNKDRIDVILSDECQKKQRDLNTQCKKSNIPAAENVDELMSENSTDNFDTTKADMDTCGRLAVGHAVENASPPKGWEIGPLFQSFKSKMASFTEIVMSPVKLFRAYSPPPTTDHPDKLNECELPADGTSGAEHSKPSNTFYSEAQNENVNQDVGASPQTLREVEHKQDAKTFGINYSKRLAFDEELSACSSEHTDECAKTLKEENTPESVPLQLSPSHCIVSEDILEAVESVFKSSILLQPSAYLSASQESQLNSSSTKEEQKGELAARLKPLRRKCTGKRKKITSDTPISEFKKKDSELAVIDEQLSLMDSVKLNNASDIDKTLSLSSLVSCTQQSDCDYRRKMKSGHLVHQSLRRNLRDTANGRTLTPKLVTRQLESQMKHLQPTAYSSAGVGRAKREQNLDCHSQGFVKRKRLTVDVCKIESKQQDFCNKASERDVLRGLRTPRKEDVLTNTVVDREEMLRPVKRRQLVSLRTNKEQKQEILTRLNKAVLNPQTDNSCEAMLICSLDKRNIVSEDNQKGRSKVKPSGSCKRQKMRTVLGNPNVNIDNMDLETTIEITSTNQSKEAHLSEVLVCPDIRQLHSTRKCKGMKKLLKRKSPKQISSPTESDYSVDSTPPEPSVEPLEEKSIDSNTSQLAQKEEYRNFGPNQLSKRSKKGLRSAVKSSAAGESRETDPCNQHLITKENLSQKDTRNSRIPMDRVYFEMTSFESKHQSSSSSQPHLDFPMQLDDINRKERDTPCMEGEACPTEFSNNIINASRLRSCARGVNIKPKQADSQRRKCRVLRCRTRNGAEVVKKSTIVDNADLATSDTHLSEKTSSRSLLRSYSCPEILSLHSSDVSWRSMHSPPHSRIHTSYQHQVSHSPFSQHTHKSLRRARRHTVCSVEVEREIAPLCLRKEVYPSRRSVPYDGTSQILSPNLSHSLSSSLSSLATCFLSSPLAFLSKKVDSRGTAARTSTSSHVSSPTSSSSLSLSPWHRPRFQGTDSSNAAFGLSSSVTSLECEIERRQSEEEDDGENTSSSSQDFEDVVLREEKALSDSEIKVVQKLEERGKVSSIRIRKTLPKPQYNLTPMGLPKPIRLKKKEFSLEEIYTNKNFNKPPESRLETIFEVPLNRRNGSESWFGQRRLKRFMEFLEVGEARKPKKLLVGVGKAGMSSSRTRRGGFAKEEPSLSGQDVDSLLCAKLDELNLWLMHDQRDS